MCSGTLEARIPYHFIGDALKMIKKIKLIDSKLTSRVVIIIKYPLILPIKWRTDREI